MSQEIGVIGEPDFILGFNLAGVRRSFPVEDGNYAPAFEAIVKDSQGLGIVVAPGDAIDSLPALLRQRVSDSIAPVFIGLGEGAGEGDLREKVKRAIGIDLFK